MWNGPHMGWWHDGWAWWMALHGLFWFAVVVGSLALVVTLLRRASREAPPSGARGALAILEERYARGEIGRDEYRQKRQDLEGVG